VRVQANLQALAAYGLNIDDLRTTISNANSNAPKGSFDGAARSYTINANDQIKSAEEYKQHRRRLQERRAGAAVRRRHVVESAENTKLASWMNTTPAVILSTCSASPAPTSSRGRQHQGAAAADQAGLPGQSSTSTVLTDRTNTIRASVTDVQFELTSPWCWSCW
jgi:multidrug efflux pump